MIALVISCSPLPLVTRSTRFWYSTTIVPARLHLVLAGEAGVLVEVDVLDLAPAARGSWYSASRSRNGCIAAGRPKTQRCSGSLSEAITRRV